jgi:hypothetical protein
LVRERKSNSTNSGWGATWKYKWKKCHCFSDTYWQTWPSKKECFSDRYWQTWLSKKEAYCCRFGGVEVPGGSHIHRLPAMKIIQRGWYTKSQKFTANMQHARRPKIGRGHIGRDIHLPLSQQLHSSTCAWIDWELCCTQEALAWRQRSSTLNPFSTAKYSTQYQAGAPNYLHTSTSQSSNHGQLSWLQGRVQHSSIALGL